MRKKLVETGIELLDHRHDEHHALNKKIESMRERGLSYQVIADTFNLWKIPTRSREGNWHAKTIREISN